MAHDAFICHSAKDKTTADAVCAMLESSGIRCWIAPRDVTAGMEWSECIIDAIEECRVMVLVFTTNANESPQIRREVERAVNRGVAILPLRIEDILPGRALEYFIGNVHWLDAMTPPLESHLHNLAGTVKILLGRLPQHVSPIPHASTISPVVQAAAAGPAVFPHTDPAPPKVEWIEPAHPRVVEPAPPEVLKESTVRGSEPPRVAPTPPLPLQEVRQQPVEIRESSGATPPAATQAAAATVASTAAPAVASAMDTSEKLKRPIGVTAIAILNFVFAGLMVIAFSAISDYERNEYGIWLVLLGIGAVVAGYGLMKLKNWGRTLEIVLAGTGIGWLITVVAEPSHQFPGFTKWLAILALFVRIFSYMFTRQVKLAFGSSLQSAANFGAVPSTVSAPRQFPSAFFAKGTGRRPMAVLVIAILSFAEAGIWVLPIAGDFDRNRVAPRDPGALLLVCAAAAVGYGLIKLMNWARLLKVVVAAVDAILMISVAQEAFHEGGFGEVMWIVMFIYIIWSALYLFTPRMRQAFSKTA